MNYIRPLTDKEREDILRDGQRMRVPLMMRDNAATFADEQRAKMHGISVSQAAYENRLADAYRNPPPEQVQAAAPAQVTDNGQQSYEQRIKDAWKVRSPMDREAGHDL